MSNSATYRWRSWIRVVEALALVLVFVTRWVPLQAQTATNASAAGATELVTQIQSKLGAAQEELNRTQLTQTNLPPGATAAEVIDYRSLLQRLIRTYQFQLDDLATLAAVRERAVELEHTRLAWTGFAEPPPYPVLMVDDLRDAVQSVNDKIEAGETTLKVIESFVAETRSTLEQSDEKLRRLNEQLERTTDPALGERLNWQRELERVRDRVAAASTAAFETKRQLTTAELSEDRNRLAFARRQLLLASQQVVFSQADLDKVLSRLDDKQHQIEAEIQAADADLEARRQALTDARENLRLALQTPQAGRTNAAALRQWRELVEVRSLQSETAGQRLTMLRQVLGAVSTERDLWQLRFAIFDSKDASTLQAATRRLAWISKMIETAQPYYQQQATLAASQLADEQDRQQNRPEGSAEQGLRRERLADCQQRVEYLNRSLLTLAAQERLVSRWQESLAARREALPFLSRVADLFTDASGFISKLWHFELFTAEDTITVDGQQFTGRRGITAGKILMALFILVLGYWLADVFSRMIEPIAIRRLKIEKNQASLIRRWVRVVLLICLAVFSLMSVKIPLTVFAFAGGALAIGVGFGTQTLLKNFISGIIILFERPFRVGDVLDVGGQRGTVTGIGIRSSVLQLWDNTETIIPNSALLEQNLTNWTYSNQTVRFFITLGVAYGSDTRRVTDLLADIASRHGLVQKEPKPQVLFTDFGDSALTFELRYWLDVHQHNNAQVASDVRHMIAVTFAENGIAIAFPQRDVHLDSAKPLLVQMVPVTQVAPPEKPAAPPSPGTPPDRSPKNV